MENALLYSKDEIRILDLSRGSSSHVEKEETSEPINLVKELLSPATIDCSSMNEINAEVESETMSTIGCEETGGNLSDGLDEPLKQHLKYQSDDEIETQFAEIDETLSDDSSRANSGSSGNEIFDPELENNLTASPNQNINLMEEEVHSYTQEENEFTIETNGSNDIIEDVANPSIGIRTKKTVNRLKIIAPARKKHKLESIAKKLLMTELQNMASVEAQSIEQLATDYINSGPKNIASHVDNQNEDESIDTVIFIASDSDNEAEVTKEVKEFLMKTIKPKKRKKKELTKYFCEVCGKEFTVKSNMTRHTKLHFKERRQTPRVQLQFSCDICGKVFRKKYRLARHERAHNKKKKVLSCTLCEKTFSTKGSFQTHLKVHAGQKPWECDECGMKFKHQSNMISHLKIHAGIKPHSCEECGKCFARRSDLKNHIRTHTGEKPYLCTTCGKEFAQRGHLDNHAKIHSGVKPHTCETCGRGFRRRTDMNRHIRTHTGVKPYICEVCGKSFGQSGQFLIHTRVHTGEKPYWCEKCFKRFAVLYGFRQHQKMCTVGDEVPLSLVCNNANQITQEMVQEIVANMK